MVILCSVSRTIHHLQCTSGADYSLLFFLSGLLWHYYVVLKQEFSLTIIQYFVQHILCQLAHVGLSASFYSSSEMINSVYLGT
jgi:hypothetical protein